MPTWRYFVQDTERRLYPNAQNRRLTPNGGNQLKRRTKSCDFTLDASPHSKIIGRFTHLDAKDFNFFHDSDLAIGEMDVTSDHAVTANPNGDPEADRGPSRTSGSSATG